MPIYLKRLISLLTIISFILLLNACMPRQSDGTYHSAYSYHPYKKVKQTKSIKKSYSIHNEMKPSNLKYQSKKIYPDDNPPSNVPRNFMRNNSINSL